MKRYGLSLRRKASVDQKDLDQLIDKLVTFVLHVCRLAMKHPYDATNIIAMDEPPPPHSSEQIWSLLQQWMTQGKKYCDCKNSWTRMSYDELMRQIRKDLLTIF